MAYNRHCAKAHNRMPDLISPHLLTINLLSDSQSSLRKLKQGAYCQSDSTAVTIWESLSLLNDDDATVTLLFVPAHCRIQRNEKVDAIAKSDCNEDQVDAPVSQAVAKSTIVQQVKKTWRLGITPHFRKAKPVHQTKEFNLNRHARVDQIRGMPILGTQYLNLHKSNLV